MGGAQQPFLYDAEWRNSRSPEKPFDPKAVTRASWEPKPPKPRQDGPLLAFNRHPDAHEVLGPRRSFRTMSPRAKRWIKRMRVVQMGLRGLELIGATGVLVLMILITNMQPLTAWVMRITAGVVMVLSTYSIYHHSRPAGARPPASSAAFQFFSALSDVCVLPLYAYGGLAAHNDDVTGGPWTTLLPIAGGDVAMYLAPALYYTLVAAGGLHVVSLAVSLWLGLKFRQITLMPPDMNPLEDHLTSRVSAGNVRQQHKRNKSSVATTTTASTGSGDLEGHRRSGAPYEDLSRRPPTVPFMHTRQGSDVSSSTARDRKRNSRADLPSRQYNDSLAEPSSPAATLKRSSVSPRPPTTTASSSYPAPPPTPPHYTTSPPRATTLTKRGPSAYAEIPLDDLDLYDHNHTHDNDISSRPSTGSVASSQVTVVQPDSTTAAQHQPRAARFTEAWYASDSLISRTQQRNRALNGALSSAKQQRQQQRWSAYEAVSQRYDDDVSDESDGGNENENENITAYDDGDNHHHPNPLRSNPPPAKPAKRPHTPFQEAPLREVGLNDRRVSGGAGSIIYGGEDISDAGAKPAPLAPQQRRRAQTPGPREESGRAENDDDVYIDESAARERGGGSSKTKKGDDVDEKKKKKKKKKKRGSLVGSLSLTSGGLANTNPATWRARNRDSSIQPESDFYSKPYGDLRAGTPPVILDSVTSNNNRQVSSGNDYYSGSAAGTLGRRNVSGKIAEEGLAGGIGLGLGGIDLGVVGVGRRYSRYSVLNED